MFCSQFPKSRIFRPHTKLAISKGKQATYNKEINFLIFHESEITVSKKIYDKFALRGVWMTCMSREHDVSPRTVTRNANVIHSSRVCLTVWCEIPSNQWRFRSFSQTYNLCIPLFLTMIFPSVSLNWTFTQRCAILFWKLEIVLRFSYHFPTYFGRVNRKSWEQRK